LTELALPADAAVIVHSSLSALGWVAGGAQAVVEALVQVLASAGTLVMPTQSTHLCDPRRWENPPVPESWWETIRRELPAYDPLLTPTVTMGAIVECFRHVPGVKRSAHPMVSFGALGPRAGEIVADHSLECGLGEGSPLARLYDLDGFVVLVGVGFDRCTALHLAEFRASYSGKEWFEQASPLLINGTREWVAYRELDGDTDDFERLGTDFVASGKASERPLAGGRMTMMRIRDLVDFAVGWFEANR
jgi:aminoglycoside 3-N-acetyltransferase